MVWKTRTLVGSYFLEKIIKSIKVHRIDLTCMIWEKNVLCVWDWLFEALFDFLWKFKRSFKGKCINEVTFWDFKEEKKFWQIRSMWLCKNSF